MEFKKLVFGGFTYMCEKQAMFGGKVVFLFVFHLEDEVCLCKMSNSSAHRTCGI